MSPLKRSGSSSWVSGRHRFIILNFFFAAWVPPGAVCSPAQPAFFTFFDYQSHLGEKLSIIGDLRPKVCYVPALFESRLSAVFSKVAQAG